MSALSELLERLRLVQPPPGAAARVVAVPSADDRLSGEVSVLFSPLDDLQRQCDLVVSSARSEAAGIEAAAAADRRRLLEDARVEAERLAAEVLAERRAESAQRAQQMLLDAEREAERVRARGKERIPVLVQEIAEHILGGAG